MKIASLQVGQALILDQEHCTIVRITENDLCSLERTKDRAILTRTKAELINLFLIEKVVFQGKETDKKPTDTNKQAMDLKTLPEKQQIIALKRYEYIKEAEKQHLEPCCVGLESIIAKVSQQLADNNPPSPITVYRWWQRWRKGDRNITSLVNYQRGSKGHRKFNDQFKALFNELLEAIYLKREKCTRQSFHLALCHKIKQHNQITREPINIPSQATSYRMLDNVDKYTVMAAKYGRRKAEQYFRTVGKGIVPEYILERVEVDHTPLDVMVVDEITGLVIGRPYLTCLFEVKARMPLGIEIGFEPPSYLSVIRALRQAILPKESISQCYLEIKNTWPAFGIPNTLVCDNGLEFHSAQLTRVCAELNIELIYCPKQQPNYKGSVERFLGTLNNQVCHQLKGTTFSNINQRGDYNSAQEACITLEQLKEIIYQWLIDDYCQSPHKALTANPLIAWQEGLKQTEPSLPESKQALELILSHEVKRKLSHQGIQFLQLFYNTEELRTIRIRYGNQSSVTIRVNLENLGKIWVYDQYSGQYLIIPCTEPEYAEGITLRQHKAVLKERIAHKHDRIDTESLFQQKEALRHKIQQANQTNSLRKRTRAKRLNTPALKAAYDINVDQLPNIPKAEAGFLLDDLDIPDFAIMPPHEDQ
ncbi:integrase [Entomomonas moraniae]|uniref:Integrase n=1 Tax=Entomomonas moraniae TaxID=2213226 RepID=A0A451EP12_9GAMM|nr:Mu transposase C-terminal domain-containing protein [Entomomonas moraniae]AZS51523.1 integrase [Entomomonas moraniae]